MAERGRQDSDLGSSFGQNNASPKAIPLSEIIKSGQPKIKKKQKKGSMLAQKENKEAEFQKQSAPTIQIKHDIAPIAHEPEPTALIHPPFSPLSKKDARKKEAKKASKQVLPKISKKVSSSRELALASSFHASSSFVSTAKQMAQIAELARQAAQKKAEFTPQPSQNSSIEKKIVISKLSSSLESSPAAESQKSPPILSKPSSQEQFSSKSENLSASMQKQTISPQKSPPILSKLSSQEQFSSKPEALAANIQKHPSTEKISDAAPKAPLFSPLSLGHSFKAASSVSSPLAHDLGEPALASKTPKALQKEHQEKPASAPPIPQAFKQAQEASKFSQPLFSPLTSFSIISDSAKGHDAQKHVELIVQKSNEASIVVASGVKSNPSLLNLQQNQEIFDEDLGEPFIEEIKKPLVEEYSVSIEEIPKPKQIPKQKQIPTQIPKSIPKQIPSHPVSSSELTITEIPKPKQIQKQKQIPTQIPKPIPKEIPSHPVSSSELTITEIPKPKQIPTQIPKEIPSHPVSSSALTITEIPKPKAAISVQAVSGVMPKMQQLKEIKKTKKPQAAEITSIQKIQAPTAPTSHLFKLPKLVFNPIPQKSQIPQPMLPISELEIIAKSSEFPKAAIIKPKPISELEILAQASLPSSAFSSPKIIPKLKKELEIIALSSIPSSPAFVSKRPPLSELEIIPILPKLSKPYNVPKIIQKAPRIEEKQQILPQAKETLPKASLFKLPKLVFNPIPQKSQIAQPMLPISELEIIAKSSEFPKAAIIKPKPISELEILAQASLPSSAFSAPKIIPKLKKELEIIALSSIPSSPAFVSKRPPISELEIIPSLPTLSKPYNVPRIIQKAPRIEEKQILPQAKETIPKASLFKLPKLVFNPIPQKSQIAQPILPISELEIIAKSSEFPKAAIIKPKPIHELEIILSLPTLSKPYNVPKIIQKAPRIEEKQILPQAKETLPKASLFKLPKLEFMPKKSVWPNIPSQDEKGQVQAQKETIAPKIQPSKIQPSAQFSHHPHSHLSLDEPPVLTLPSEQPHMPAILPAAKNVPKPSLEAKPAVFAKGQKDLQKGPEAAQAYSKILQPKESEPKLVLSEIAPKDARDAQNILLSGGPHAVSFSSIINCEEEMDSPAAMQRSDALKRMQSSSLHSPLPSEWDKVYKSEFVRTLPPLPVLEEWWSSAGAEAEKYLFALRAEALYWKMRSIPSSDPASKEAEKEFLSTVQSSSPDQRLAIEMCINLTKALQAVMIASDPSSSPPVAMRAKEIYQQILYERPEIKPILHYRIARIALQRSYKPGSGEPSEDYMRFISTLPEPMQDASCAMRACFFDRIIKDPSSSAALRSFAAEHYSKLLLNRPSIQSPLMQYLKVRQAMAEFFASTEDEVGKRWAAVLNQPEEVRSILLYELASIFIQAEHAFLVQQKNANERARENKSMPYPSKGKRRERAKAKFPAASKAGRR